MLPYLFRSRCLSGACGNRREISLDTLGWFWSQSWLMQWCLVPKWMSSTIKLVISCIFRSGTGCITGDSVAWRRESQVCIIEGVHFFSRVHKFWIHLWLAVGNDWLLLSMKNDQWRFWNLKSYICFLCIYVVVVVFDRSRWVKVNPLVFYDFIS